MTDVQALLSGLIAGGLLRAKADGYSTLEIETQVDEQQNYLPVIFANMNGERYVITITPDRPADHGQEAPRPPETGHSVIIAKDGQVSFDHPAGEVKTAACEVLEAYGAELLPVAQQPPGRYAVYRETPDQGDLDAPVGPDDAPAPRWYLVRLIDDAVDPALSDLCLVETGWNGRTGIPLPVTLVSMGRSGYILRDRWDWFWMVPPEGEPYHMNEATAEKTTSTSDWDLVGQSFTTWEALHYFLQCRVAHRTEESNR